MELYHLRTLLVVAEEQSITRAAKRLFTTPPSVSAHIKALEDEWNVSLFRRTAKGMEITEKGERLRRKAEATLLAAQDLANHATELQGYLMGTLSVGLNTSASFLRIPQVLESLQKHCPGVELGFVNSASGRIIDDLRSQTLDAGYIFGPLSGESIVSHRLSVTELAVAVPKQWETDIFSADWTAIAKLPWIHSDGYCPFQHIVDRLFRDRGLQYERTVQTDDDRTKADLISAGVGLALLEKTEAQQAVDQGKAVIWQTDPILCDLSFGYLSTRREDPLIRALRRAVLDVWGVVTDVSSTARQTKSN